MIIIIIIKPQRQQQIELKKNRLGESAIIIMNNNVLGILLENGSGYNSRTIV